MGRKSCSRLKTASWCTARTKPEPSGPCTWTSRCRLPMWWQAATIGLYSQVIRALSGRWSAPPRNWPRSRSEAFVIASTRSDSMSVIRDPDAFDSRSGNTLERLIFNHRLVVLIISTLLTLFFGYEATKTRVNASFEKMLPQSQEYIKNYLANRGALRSLGNSIRIDVENVKGDIYSPDYLEVLQRINDAVYLMPGVDRPFMKSLWTPSVR